MKVLQGQQLYISKHMHGQLLHEEIGQPRPRPPRVLINPCVTACTLGGQLLDFPAIAVVTGPESPYWRTGWRIGEASYEFRGVPETIPLTRLYTAEYGWWESLIPTIDTLDKLRAAHWLKCWLHFDILAQIGAFYSKWCRMAPYTEPYTTHAVGDMYHDTFTLGPHGTLYFQISFTVQDPATLSYNVEAFLCPPGFRLKLFGGQEGFSVPFWQGGRYMDGTYWTSE